MTTTQRTGSLAGRALRTAAILVAPLLLLLVLGASRLSAEHGHLESEHAIPPEEWDRLVAEFERARLAGIAADPEPAPSTVPWREAEAPVAVSVPITLPSPEATTSILDLQPFRTEEEIAVVDPAGTPGRARLIDLNPHVGAWYLLELEWENAPGEIATYHLENIAPERQRLRLLSSFPTGVVADAGDVLQPCPLWDQEASPPLATAAQRSSPYVLLCDGRVLLRLPIAGHRTTLEYVTDTLRDGIWGGEAITSFVRSTLYRDAFMETSDLNRGTATTPQERSDAPTRARLDPAFRNTALTAPQLGLDVPEVDDQGFLAGHWYAEAGNPGVWVSVMRPDLIAPEILAAQRDIVSPLDEVESTALAYLVAIDLDHHELGFVLGTDHPRLDWSDRVDAAVANPALQGPDGFDQRAPLVSNGILSPALVPRVVATFTGGFKRSHGAFRHGPLARVHRGTHYGFIENGVVFSRLWPGLATVLVLTDGAVQLKTWEPEDDALIGHVRFARQNGVPLLERDAASDRGVPGALVSQWGAGNWSGSSDGRFRTLRAGLCTTSSDSKRFLVYGYFSTATPSAMARVFEAYGCDYAMHLDMNALEHTYLATYELRDSNLAIQHLVRGMNVLDRPEGDLLLGRFLGVADNRDFFYVLRRPPASPER